MTPGPRFPRILLSLLLAAASTAFAQTDKTNAHVSINTRIGHLNFLERAPVGTTVEFLVDAGWGGGIARDVVVDIEVPGVVLAVSPVSGEGVVCSLGMESIRCAFTPIVVEHRDTIIVKTLQATAGDFTAVATISTSTRDETTYNNRATRRMQVVDRPSLNLDGAWIAPHRVDPAQQGTITASLVNDGAAATNATLTFTLPEGGTFIGATPQQPYVTCAVASATEVVCRAEQLGFFQFIRATATFTVPDKLDGGRVVTRMIAASDGADFDPGNNARELSTVLIRHILVTNTRDAGAGSLRQALLDAAIPCESEPCTIDFRIPAPVPEDGWFTIRPVTPLPEVWGLVKIDGATQTRFTGDTNADGPEIEINGSLLREGDGFVLRRQCDAAVLDLAINGFPRHAIELHHEGRYESCSQVGSAFYPLVARNFLGTDPRGLTAVPNERGVVLSAGHGVYIDDNLISGNRRAGIFLGAGFYALIDENRIGVNAKGEPLGNGASGIFLNIGEGDAYHGGGADIEDNVIAYNGEWGVCRTSLGSISLKENSIHGNTSAGFDVGLDNVTPNVANDSKTTPNKPVLFSAAYDPAQQATIIRGRLDSDGGNWFRIDVYASAGLSAWGYPEGEEMVESLELNGRGHSDFEIVVPRDLRGAFITATNNRTRIVGWAKSPLEQSHQTNIPTDTSEFSDAVEVR